ncbi:MAG: hypothetical protein Q9165_007186 [Trypethelium subeluteriae]
MEAVLLGSGNDLDRQLVGSQNVAAKNFLGQTALHLAIRQPKLLRKLIPRYEHTDVSDRWGITPLIYAFAYRQTDSVLLLLEAGSAPKRLFDAQSFKFIWGLTPEGTERHLFTLALQHWKKSLDADSFQNFVDDLMSEYAWYCIGHRIYASGLLQELLKFGANPNKVITRGRYPEITLLDIVSNNSEAKALSEAGFSHDINHADLNGQTILMKAVRSRNAALVEEHLKKGALLAQQDKQGWSVLHHAAQELQEIIWDPSVANTYGETRLTQCSEMINMIKILLRWGADPNARDHCLCACSDSGCSPTTILLRGYFRAPWIWTCWAGGWWLEWLNLLSGSAPEPYGEHIMLDGIRMKRFNDHDLTHVCCRSARYAVPNIESDDIPEILDEESEIIRDLEDDMMQFLSSQQGTELEEKLVEQLAQSFRIRLKDQLRLEHANHVNLKALSLLQP